MATQQKKEANAIVQLSKWQTLTKTYSVEEASALLNTLPKAKVRRNGRNLTPTSPSILVRAIRWFVELFRFQMEAVRLFA